VNGGPVERSRDFERFVTFIDAMVAIAITLLVLPLVDMVGELGDGAVGALLSAHTDEIGGFLLSFVVIANAWFTQHHVVRSVIAPDQLVMRLMMFWTLTIVILPFPTALVAKAGHDPTTKIFYIGTLALTSGTVAVLCWAVGRKRDIRDTDDKPNPALGIGSTIGFVVALAISLMVPSTSYYPLLLLLLPGPVIALWRRARRRSGKPASAPRTPE
jgi:uncharacterized membrane protein